MDANLSEETISIVRELRMVSSKKKINVYKYFNTHKPKIDYSVDFMEDLDQILSKMYSD